MPSSLPLREQQLLVDHVAQQVVQLGLGIGLRDVLLARLLHHLLAGALVFGARDDLVVYTRHDVFDDRAIGRDRRRRRKGRKLQLRLGLGGCHTSAGDWIARLLGAHLGQHARCRCQ